MSHGDILSPIEVERAVTRRLLHVIAAILLPWQVLPPAVPVFRQIRAGERQRFAVESSWDSPNGKATYRYDMDLRVEKRRDKRIDWPTMVRIQGLDASYDGVQTHVDNAGLIPFNLSAGGGPTGIAAGGQITTFALPLLALTLPQDAPGADGGFPIKEIHIERVGVFRGTGTYRLEGRSQKVHLRMTLSDAREAPVYEGDAEFDALGRLLLAKGNYREDNGSLTFTVRAR